MHANGSKSVNLLQRAQLEVHTILRLMRPTSQVPQMVLIEARLRQGKYASNATIVCKQNGGKRGMPGPCQVREATCVYIASKCTHTVPSFRTNINDLRKDKTQREIDHVKSSLSKAS